MKQCAIASLSLVFLLGPNAAFAQAQPTPPKIIDVSKVTCKDLLESKAGDIAIVSVWLSGYYHGRVRDTKLDLKKYVENSKLLGDLCAKDLKQPVMTVIAKYISDQELAERKEKVQPPPAISEKKK